MIFVYKYNKWGVIIKKEIEINIEGIIDCLKHNLKLIRYLETDLINVTLELNLDYLDNVSEEVKTFDKEIEFNLDDISNFMSLEINKYDVTVLENKGIILSVEFVVESVIEEYKDEIMDDENELFDEVLERKCPDILDSVEKSIYFNKDGNYLNYKVLFLNDDNYDELVEKYKLDEAILYNENMVRKSKIIIKNE